MVSGGVADAGGGWVSEVVGGWCWLAVRDEMQMPHLPFLEASVDT